MPWIFVKGAPGRILGMCGAQWSESGAIAACVPLQLAFIHAPAMRAAFGSACLGVFLVAELEKWVLRRDGLGRGPGARYNAGEPGDA